MKRQVFPIIGTIILQSSAAQYLRELFFVVVVWYASATLFNF